MTCFYRPEIVSLEIETPVIRAIYYRSGSQVMLNRRNQTRFNDMKADEISSSSDALVTEEQAAELLALSVRTLQAWRLRGAGPAFVRAGAAVRYQRKAIAEWIANNTVSR
jgi:predicted DNA-binding transcriptional regulator AlpA